MPPNRPGVVRQQRLERDKVVALHNEIAVARFTASEFGHILEQMKGNLLVMVHHRLFPNPVQLSGYATLTRPTKLKADSKIPSPLIFLPLRFHDLIE